MSDLAVNRVKRGHRHELRVPVLYVDLDGTIRHGLDELGRFVNGPDDVVIFPEVPPLLAAYKAAGWRIVSVSNQGGVALGHVSEKNVTDAMNETYKQSGEMFDKMMWCVHHPDAKDPELAVCWCRKPRPGLLMEAVFSLASDLSIAARIVPEKYTPEIYPPHLALMVGDREEDRACAEAVGIKFMDAREWRAGGHTI